MRYINENCETIDESEVDLLKGYCEDIVILKKDAIEPDHITKYAYDDDDYETVRMYIRIPEDEPIRQEIQERKQFLSDTDYVVLKIAEGAATYGEYADVIFQRQLARERINELEYQLLELQL